MSERWTSMTAALCVLLALAVTAQAQSKQGAGAISLHAALQMALDQNPGVMQTRALVDQSDARVRQAQAAWFPTLQLNSSLSQYQKPMPVWPFHGFDLTKIPPFDKTVVQSAVQVDYTLFDGGARRAKVRQASRLRDASGATHQATAQALMTRVIAAYLSVLANQELDAAHQGRIDAVRAELDRVTQLRQVGRAADVDVARADAALASAEADRVQVQGALDVSRRELARLIGTPDDSVAVSPVSPTSPEASATDPTAWAQQAITHSPEVEAAQMRVAAARAGMGVVRGSRWPSIGLRGSWVDFRDGSGRDTDEWNAMAFIGIPLFTGGAISGAVQEAGATQRAAEEGLRAAQDRVSAQMDQTIAQWNESRARVASLERAVASLAEVTRIEKLRLTTGSDTQADYLRAEADLLTARAGLIGARHAAILARVDVARLVGELDMTWVEGNLEQGL